MMMMMYVCLSVYISVCICVSLNMCLCLSVGISVCVSVCSHVGGRVVVTEVTKADVADNSVSTTLLSLRLSVCVSVCC